jgi:hypothetical protein
MKQGILLQVGRQYVTYDIYKGKGDKRGPANYRGILLLSTLPTVHTGVLDGI